MSEILRELNPSQREAVIHYEGPLLILAGAGSGKTRAITHRIAYLIRHYQVPPAQILGVTFTNKAADEMRVRVEKLLPAAVSTPWIGTFHATCSRILRREIEHLSAGYNGYFSILDAQDQRRAIEETMRELDLPTDSFPPRMVAAEIERAKNELIYPEDFRRRRAGSLEPFLLDPIAAIYTRYQEKLRNSNAVDFGDLIGLTVRLFQDDLELLDGYRDRFRFILIDEYQDTNYTQYLFARLLAEKYENLCVVGDDDQSIFGWRGADPTNILEFERDFPDATVVKLERNYRSTKRILRVADTMIRHNRWRQEKHLYTEREEGTKVQLYAAVDEIDEARFVAAEIERLRSQGVPLREIAVLYRVNTLSRNLEEALIERRIPYEIVRGFKFYERREVKDILAYLKCLVNPQDDLSLIRIINRPRRGIGPKTQAAIQNRARSQEISIWAAIQEMAANASPDGGGKLAPLKAFADLMADLKQDHRKPSELTEELVARIGYRKVLEAEADGIEAEERMGNIAELIGQIKTFEAQDPDNGLAAFLERVSLVTDVDGYNREVDRVALMTLHTVKGLEFSWVFIVGMEERLLPHLRSIEEGRIAEERRLNYVGITRVKEGLFLSYAHHRYLYGQSFLNVPSRFLGELPPEDLEEFHRVGSGTGLET
ncbi:MAG: ATP-dependent helicase [Candidatus Bipolaricaulia bacterium]